MLIMEHHDKAVHNEDEKALNNLLNYKQSYFMFNNTDHIFPLLNLTNKTSLPIGPSEDYCMHLWWRPQSRDKYYPEEYKNVSDLPACENSKNTTKFLWGAHDRETGLSFKAWR